MFFMLGVMGSACLSTSLLIALFKRSSSRRRSLVAANGIPHVGGIALGIAFVTVAASALFMQRLLSPGLCGIIAASAVMFFFGVLDDVRELSVRTKLLVQSIAVACLLALGVKTQIAYIGEAANIVITYTWILGMTNAFNHLDVLDGLAGGVGVLAAAGFLSVAIATGNVPVAILMACLIGALGGFLSWNLPPAKVYMGNAGSHWLGFVLAACALMLSYASLANAIALLSPLLIMGFAIFDTLFLIMMRILKKRSIVKKSDDHLALRYLRRGYSKESSLANALFLAALCVFAGVALIYVPGWGGLGLVASVIIVHAVVAIRMSYVPHNG